MVKVKFYLTNGEAKILETNLCDFDTLIKEIDSVLGEGFIIFDDIAIKKKNVIYIEMLSGEPK